MFFYLARTKNRKFPNQYQMGNLILNTDNGWDTIDTDNGLFVFKGYAYDCTLEHILLDLENPKPGNYCVFYYNKNSRQVKIFTDLWRSFTIYYKPEHNITNLVKNDHPIWSDASIIQLDQHMAATITYTNLVGEFTTQYTYNQVFENTYSTLRKRIENFIKNNQLPLKVFLSGGADSTLVYSFVKNFTDDYEYVFQEIIEWDYFVTHNRTYIKDNFWWAYTQIHHWVDPCVITSGAPGDEYFFRSPKIIDLWLSWHKEDWENYLNEDVRYSQKSYYEKHLEKMSKDKNYQKYKKEVIAMPRKQFLTALCNNVLNDSQHWHFGNTYTFTPLRDFETFKGLVQLSPDDLRGQIVGSQFTLDLINRNDSQLTDILSPAKHKETLVNVYNFMQTLNKN